MPLQAPKICFEVRIHTSTAATSTNQNYQKLAVPRGPDVGSGPEEAWPSSCRRRQPGRPLVDLAAASPPCPTQAAATARSPGRRACRSVAAGVLSLIDHATASVRPDPENLSVSKYKLDQR
jgi:hypothetical protein